MKFLPSDSTTLNSTNQILDIDIITDFDNSTLINGTYESLENVGGNYWYLILIIVPCITLFGNVLVILSVYRERALQSVTNYFIVSLAVADLLVAIGAMPFAVYALINGKWGLPQSVCDMYIATDVICSTSSILNLVAISIDRYIAITRPIQYAKHKNSKRAPLTILVVWLLSAAVGIPILLGLNNTPDRKPELCAFYNADFILLSSLTSFYIPMVIMVYLYYSIFKALRIRAQKAKASRRPHLTEKPGIVIENVAQTRRLAETTLGASTLLPCTGGASSYMEEGPTNTGSGSQEEDDEGDRSPASEDCHVISNDKSAEFILATVVEESTMVVTLASQQSMRPSIGNNDSGYAASNIEEIALQTPPTPHKSLPNQIEQLTNKLPIKREESEDGVCDNMRQEHTPLKRTVSSGTRAASEDEDFTCSKKERKTSNATRFTICKVNKASRKKREKSLAKKERKATKTLAIVLGVFLVCWVPFFSCNVLDAICTKINSDFHPGVTAFILTTWLGYMNSFVNPIIYTIFNQEFRKAFKKIMRME